MNPVEFSGSNESTKMSVIENLGGQWVTFFEGEQSGNGLVSFNTFGSSGGYASLYQQKNPDKATGAVLLQGRTTSVTCTDTSFEFTIEPTNESTPSLVKVAGRRGSQEPKDAWAGEWNSTDNLIGTFKMIKLKPRRVEGAVPRIESWNNFSDWVEAQSTNNAVYRGLGSSQHLLVSTAHRAGIFDLHHYLFEILPRVRAELLKRHGLRINLSEPDGLAEMLALIRHHGFPSPIMDWSNSPWVALYFAIASFNTLKANPNAPDFCRIYRLQHSGIFVDADVQGTLLAPSIERKLVEIPTPMTSRVTAQEGVFLLTPCVDVLIDIEHEQRQNNNVLIDAIDIDVRMVDQAQRRLDQMMINEATMLSSIDSTLSHLRKKFTFAGEV